MKKQNKSEILSCRVTPEQRGIIERKAYSSYRTPSMYLRDCALGKEIIVINGVNELLPELRRIGNNLNQLARIANSGYTEVVNLSSVRKELSKIWQSLNSFLQDAR